MLLWQIEDYLTTSLLVLRAKIKNWKLSNTLQPKKYDYGNNKRHYLLWYEPQSEIKRNNIIFFVHGGGWNKGNPEFFKFIADYFTKLGFATVMPAYRLAPEFQFPDQQIDVFEALNKTLSILNKLSAPKNIIIAGQSAGAQLGGLLVLNTKMQNKYKIDKKLFSGFLSISGPLNLTRSCQTVRAKKLLFDFAPSYKKRKKASPIKYIDPDFNASVFCLHGAKDPLVPKAHSISFIEKLESKTRAETKLKIYNNKHHSDLTEIFFNNKKKGQAVKKWLLKIDS